MRNRKQNLQFPYYHKDHVSHLLIKFITCDTTTNISKCNFAKSCQILFCLRLAEDVLHVTRHSFRRVLERLPPPTITQIEDVNTILCATKERLQNYFQRKFHSPLRRSRKESIYISTD
jgi:hypothetical protein